jgi:hypothetical protein
MTDPAAIRARFRERGFILSDPFATALHLMVALRKPLLLEGPAGVGKTETAKVLAVGPDSRLVDDDLFLVGVAAARVRVGAALLGKVVPLVRAALAAVLVVVVAVATRLHLGNL